MLFTVGHKVDAVSITRLRIMMLFAALGVALFLVLSGFMDRILRQQLYDVAIHETGEPVEKAFSEVRKRILIARFVALFVVAGAFSLFANLAFRPVRRSMDLRRRFITHVSHELRTPLAVMKTSSEVALRTPDLELEKARKIIEKNLLEIRRMSNTIRFLTSFSLFENHNAIEMKPVSLQALALRTKEFFEGEAREQDIALFLNMNEAKEVPGNDTALLEIFFNLVENALCHTPKGGAITITLGSTDAGRVYFSVADTGRGIEAKELAHIFEPFYQGQNALALEREGSVGVGLSIVQEIVRLHKASVTAASEPGKGTIITVTF
jgi:two-component system sensor histidine kinase ResE